MITLQHDEDFENWQSEWDDGYTKRAVCNIHEQQHETILALSVFGKVCRESAVAWINHLQESSPRMCSVRVLLRTKQADAALITLVS